ncbi:hypothetical protein CN692_08520 [Bacillus sp. AFS002410]|uniref:hypothetical protein n=1 Tax=Bacillus sp. AFS002410 TaxID=2033481 RepID=UPI000BF1E74C|nr:hypothetical protein [Bacillus sp. AFS002410]PEJ58310.1 hypothetical protein CN692_08520 [Bacillus sp. AFS002410]
MKRYRNLAIIAVVTTISIGTFFTKVAMSESKLPKFYLKTEKGDSKYVKDLMINAGYGQDGNRGLSITTDGSEYKNSNSMLSELNADYYDLKKLNDLQKEERNFMRGKNSSSSQFYIDKDFAWHVNVKGGRIDGSYADKNNHFKMYIDGLDLQNKDRYTFKLEIPGEEKFSYISVEDVQLIGKDLVVTTSQNKTYFDKNTNSGAVDQNENVVYRINVNQKKIVDHTVINKTTNDQKNHTHTESQNIIQETDPTVPSKYSIYKKVNLKDTLQENGETTTDVISSELVLFNLETGKNEALNLSNEQKEQVKQSYEILDNNVLYFLTNKDNGISVLKYNLNSKKIDGQPLFTKVVNLDNTNYKILNGKLYALTSNEKPEEINKKLLIADLSNGHIIYEGKIDVKNIKGNSSKALKKLQVYDFLTK